jgi:NAD(P)-dependent dehydrogenase (short-subunit alcohol dehydrogenase family)
MGEGRFSGRTALVTGGSRGIGRATCLAFGGEGAAVAVHFKRGEERARETVRLIESGGGRALALQADLTAPGAADDLVRRARDVLGPVDILVNNAGEMTDSPVEGMSDESWEEAILINLTAAFRCARACIPDMKERNRGRIVNLSSQAAFTGSANHAHYAAAKAGVLGFTFSLAKELGPHGITVNAVSPGRILTDMLAARMAGREGEWLRQTPLGRFGGPGEVADAILFLSSESAGYITGANLHVNGGLVMG